MDGWPDQAAGSSSDPDQDSEIHDLFRAEATADNADHGSPSAPTESRSVLSSGIEPLDRLIGGGIPAGRMIAFISPPETQGELVLKQFVSQRSTVYLSTIRPQWEVREELADYIRHSRPGGTQHNLKVDHVSPDRLLDSAERYLAGLGTKSNLIIDSIDEFEFEDRSRYVDFLNLVKKTLWETGSVGLFYGMADTGEHPARSLTLKRSDIVWELRRQVASTDIHHHLIMSKFRGGEALTEPVKLVLTDEVRIDTSRDIA